MNDINLIEHLPILILYPHNRCNCRCVMCDMWKARAKVEISPSEIKQQAADIEILGVKWAVLSGGEPLMHSDLPKLIAAFRERNIRITVLSAGLLLKQNASLAVRDFDDLIVSLDGPLRTHDRIRGIPGAFKLLSEGIRAVHKLNPGYPVAARCTVQRENHTQLRETVRTARQLGLKSISFLATDVTSTAFNRSMKWPSRRQAQIALTETEIDALENEIELMISEEGAIPGFILETREKLQRILRHFRAQIGLSNPISPACNAPWVSAVILSDGSVRPCFFHDPIGNIKDRTLKEILNGDRALEFRRTLEVARNPTCLRCVCSFHSDQRPTSI